MTNPAEEAVVISGGQEYNIWTQIEASAVYEAIMDHVILTVAEISSAASAALTRLKLGPGDPAQVYLGGTLIMSGYVYMRQASFDEVYHAVQIGITSNSQNVLKGTVPGKPGQHINQSAQAIISYLYGTVGVGFIPQSPNSGTILPRFSEHIGETLYDCAERVCKMCNIHQMDDGLGNIVGFTGPNGGNTSLIEGFNILRGRLLLRNDETVGPLITVKGQQATADSTQNHNPKGEATTDATVNRPFTMMAEEPGNSALFTKRAQHEADLVKYMEVDGLITVQGWFAPDGSLWWTHGHKQELTTLQSPMLLPTNDGNSGRFMIKGVVHRQSSELGTVTDILLCDPAGMGAGGNGQLVTTS